MKKRVLLLATALVAVGLVAGGFVFAQGNYGPGRGMMGRGGTVGNRGVVGTVASVSGNTITVTSKVMPRGAAAITYTVDASGATVTKNNTASTVSAIAVGDTVMVQGTVTGTNVIAKTIRDGVGQGGQPKQPEQPIITGNGQPVVAGKVTVISGNTITITNNSNVTYTIDATSAKFVVPGVTSPTISNITVGDSVVAQGTVNGTSVTASSIIDQKPRINNGTANTGNPKPAGFMGGMMEGIKGFFGRMFGF